jgi:hypothetical protein
MGRAHSLTDNDLTTTRAHASERSHDPFANVFGTERSVSERVDVGATIVLEPAFGTGLRSELRLRLDDDLALDDDLGGLHVTAWEHKGRGAGGNWYLQRRWSAQHFLQILSQRPPISVGSGGAKTVIAGANKERARRWLMRALGGTGSESVLTSR